MANAVIEVMAEASQQNSRDELNPFKAQTGEILPSNLERNLSAFLVRKDAIVFKVNSQKLKERIAILRDQLLIAKFVGPKPAHRDMGMWLQALNQELRGSLLTICRNLGKGYFFLQSEDKDVLDNALMLSPFKSRWGTCMIQSWVLGFNLENPSNLAFPTLVTLRKLLFEHHDQAIDIAKSLREVIGMDTTTDPRFCINLQISKGWATNIALEIKKGDAPNQKVVVNYDKLPFICKACPSWQHKVIYYKEILQRQVRGGRRPVDTNPTQHEKGKNVMIDEDGFQ